MPGDDAAIYRSFAGNTRFTHPENAGPGADAWVGHRPADSAGVEGCLADRAGFAVPGTAPARIQGLDPSRLGRFGEQSQGQILLADPGGPKAVGGGAGELGSLDRGDCAGA